MTLTKAGIDDSLKDQFGFSRRQSVETVETLLKLIKQTLASVKDVLIGGFGKFCVKEKPERKGRNPATARDMMLTPRKVVTFKCSGKWDKINLKGEAYKCLTSNRGSWF